MRSLAASRSQPVKTTNHSVSLISIRSRPTRVQRAGNQVVRALPEAVASLADLDPSLLLAGGNNTPAIVGLAASLVGVLGLRFYTYMQLQYVTVSMMQRYLPDRPDTRFVQFGGSSRDLFYYPTATSLVLVVDPNANDSLLKQAGIQAGVPVEVKNVAYDDLSWRPASSLDGAFINSTLGKGDVAKVVRELHRVLKPGAPCIFVQRLQSGGIQAIAGGGDGVEVEKLNAALSQEQCQWSLCEYDVAVPNLDPHAVGLFIKPLPEALAQQASQKKKEADKKKGFN